ncbi:MAG: glycosyltransferase family 2 protein [Planctomycetes bacterium]|nr:glycosyltransferase family 2 protein [Planctomycetota bacterium]
MAKKHHLCVCICTFRRPRLLGELLRALEGQETEGLFEYSISIADNDRSGSARQTVESHARLSKLDIRYDIEPEQNIAMARNKTITNSKGDFVAIIDDDELPDQRWLLNMYKALGFFKTAGILGPIRTRYGVPPPRWVIRGGFFERPSYYSGYFLSWQLTRTGNCLLRRSLFKGNNSWFLEKFGSGGEDRDFFKRMIASGYVFVWCDEAPVFELAPPERWVKITMLKRALLRGKMTYLSKKNNPWNIMGSLTLLLVYLFAMPLLLAFSPIFGYETFMKYLVKSGDHFGKLLAVVHIDLIREKYIV